MVERVCNYYQTQQYPQVQQDYADVKKYADNTENGNKTVFGNTNVTNFAQEELNPVFNSPVTTAQTSPIQKSVNPFENSIQSPTPVNTTPEPQQNINGIATKVDALDKTVGKVLFCAVPTLRRTSSLEEKMDNKDFIPAAGLTALAIINAPEDLHDLAEGIKHGGSILTGKKYEAKYEHKVAQTDFSFLRNTLLEKWANKNEKIRNAIGFLYNNDESIYRTNFGKMIRNLLSIKEGEEIKTNMKNKFGKILKIKKIESKGLFGDLTARAMKRTTFLGLIALSLLEIPKIFKAIDKGNNIGEQTENTLKQTVKSGINVASITTGIAYGGAIGAKYGKALGSIVGMGAGAVFGSFVSQKAQGLVS